MRIDSAAMNDNITTSLRGLNKLAKILKKRRIEKGYISKILRFILITYPAVTITCELFMKCLSWTVMNYLIG